MESFSHGLAQLKEWLDVAFVTLGGEPITLWDLFYLGILLLLLIYLSGKLRNWIVGPLLARTGMEFGARQATGTIIRYVILAIGFSIIFETAGIDLTALNLLAGAVGIGLGFGLQNIVNNFISGLIILFERPIKVGDRIEVGSVSGDVVHIGARSTEVVTNDNITIIVPNSRLITENVVNWSHNERRVRFAIPLTVANDSDVQLVTRLLLEVAAANPDVLDEPAPGVRLMAFAESGLAFELRVWSTSLIQRRGLLLSALNLGILESFRAHGVVLPYPRQDVHLVGGDLQRRAE